MIMKTWTTSAGLQWLEAILQERFGHAFSLQPQAVGTLSLILSGSDRSITLTTDPTTYARSDSALPCTQWDAQDEGWHTALHSSLPAPGAEKLPTPLIATTSQGLHIGYDILGLTYWMLNRIEEIGRTDLDVHGRFPAVASHAYRHNYLERPIVDEWLHILGQAMERVWPGLTLKQHRFEMKVSHDVDEPSMYAFKSWKTIARMMAGHLLKRRDLKAFVTAPYVKIATGASLHPADPFNTFDWIMDVSEAEGLHSAFYFISGHTFADYDPDYEIDHPIIRNLIRRIHRRGHEIGLHGSYGTYQVPDLLRREADCLRRVCAEEGVEQNQWGGRMHFLRWEQPATLRAWDQAGMAYDSTLGYADRPGFRCGTCFEYPGFDPVACQMLHLRLRPLIMMECSVIEAEYLGLGTGQTALDRTLALKNACKSVGGIFTLLWHNSRCLSDEYNNFYKAIIVG